MISLKNIFKKENIFNNSALGKENLFLKDFRWFGFFKSYLTENLLKLLFD